jgi:hypothetical protein
MTEEEALEMVRDSGIALEYAPRELRTRELCMEAVRQNGLALECVPEALMTAEVCLTARTPPRFNSSPISCGSGCMPPLQTSGIWEGESWL